MKNVKMVLSEDLINLKIGCINEPTASLTTHGISGSLTPWPKYVSGSRYYIHHVTASAATTWYDGNIASASRYDADNGSALVHTIPRLYK